jgi:hypothetical protein
VDPLSDGHDVHDGHRTSSDDARRVKRGANVRRRIGVDDAGPGDTAGAADLHGPGSRRTDADGWTPLAPPHKPEGRRFRSCPGGQPGTDSVASSAGSHPETPALRPSHSRTRSKVTTTKPRPRQAAKTATDAGPNHCLTTQRGLDLCHLIVMSSAMSSRAAFRRYRHGVCAGERPPALPRDARFRTAAGATPRARRVVRRPSASRDWSGEEVRHARRHLVHVDVAGRLRWQ